jgi:hypothetical protein
MGSAIRKFVSRAPRYTLRPTDNRVMRFAHEGESQSFATRIVDISVTGVAFVVARENAPFIQETIKLEVPLGEAAQFAWWGRVVRMEEYSDEKWYLNKTDFEPEPQVLVAVRFESLPAAHIEKIHKTLRFKFAEVDAERRTEARRNIAALWTHYTWEVLFYLGVIAAGIYILWAASRPSESYDQEKGSPWGRRMWFIDK